jgi:hypothetical protein
VINALKQCEFEEFVPRIERELECEFSLEGRGEEANGDSVYTD